MAVCIASRYRDLRSGDTLSGNKASISTLAIQTNSLLLSANAGRGRLAHALFGSESSS